MSDWQTIKDRLVFLFYAALAVWLLFLISWNLYVLSAMFPDSDKIIAVCEAVDYRSDCAEYFKNVWSSTDLIITLMKEAKR